MRVVARANDDHEQLIGHVTWSQSLHLVENR